MSLCIIALSLFTENSQWRLIVIGIGTISGLGLIDIYTPKIARLSKTVPKVKTMRRLNRFFILFFIFLFTLFLWYPGAERLIESNENGLAFIVTLALMGIIGNTAPKLPFNRYMGLRLPWTIRDEETWNATHKVLGYVTFPIIIGVVAGCFFPVELSNVMASYRR